jgi:hypothetical protein
MIPCSGKKGKKGDADSPFLGATLNQLLLDKTSLVRALTFRI